MTKENNNVLLIHHIPQAILRMVRSSGHCVIPGLDVVVAVYIGIEIQLQTNHVSGVLRFHQNTTKRNK